ncbi:5-hydroxytryptamine receptor 3D [Phyllostomus discolor]|uniref:5-hydroxytryptamine receptor 3C-like n=1 Tax=Phyllostomus discolor TaxID=89673 RepID=A0A6J2KZR5_9CHIR|nr:5-hydroxytryptamine receptor 3C-like [Phyllostomus discolor]KAF6119059.1 5-hydroxytryptamine receptor 3D [Phyllostomus discolor]
MERGLPHGEGFLLCLLLHLLLQGRGNTFAINCSGFEQRGVDPAAFQAVFDRKAFLPVTNYSNPVRVNISFTLSAILEVNVQLQVMTSFLWLTMRWYNQFIRWNPEECGGIMKLSIATENLWLPDIFIKELITVDQAPTGLMAYVSSEGSVQYNKPMKVVSICSLDIFYFPFDEQNCTFTFNSFIYTVENMVLGMQMKVQDISNISRTLIQSKGQWLLLGIYQSTKKTIVGTNQYDQLVFHVAVRRRPKLYIINLLVPSSFLVAIDALSFYLPAESGIRAPFKMTLLLGYNVFLLMMNDLLPDTGTPLINVYFTICLSLMVLSLLETIFITYMLNLATTKPPPIPPWLHSLLLHCTSPMKCCPTAPQKGNKDLGLTPAHLPGLKEPVEFVQKVPGPQEGTIGCPVSARICPEDVAQKQHFVSLWIQFSRMMDTLLFRLYLLFMATSIITVIVLWNT